MSDGTILAASAQGTIWRRRERRSDHCSPDAGGAIDVGFATPTAAPLRPQERE